MQSEKCFAFSTFLLNLPAQKLWRDGVEIRLDRKPFQVLSYLVKNHGQLVPHQELILATWGKMVPGYRKSLRVHLREIRKVLGDTLGNSQFVETVRDSGYRFVASVRPPLNGHDRVEVATEEDLQWIVQTAAKIYGTKTAIPFEVKFSWYQKNPNAFWILRDGKGERVGSLEVLPLKDNAFRKFQSGEIDEKDLRPDDIYEPREAKQARILYLENFMTFVEGKSRRFPNSFVLRNCLINFGKVIETLKVDPEKTRLYAMAVEKFYSEGMLIESPSAEILTDLEFEPLKEITKQNFPLYWKSVKSALEKAHWYQERY